jgi:HEPN domain-containing protein/predicted nucleotidyltransferase
MQEADQDAILEELTRAVVERCAPERIVLFGSRARGDHHPESDYDLMVVVDLPPSSADMVVRAVHDVYSDVDVIVDTPERFERCRIDVGTLEYVADQKGRILYTRTPSSEPRSVGETPSSPPESLKDWIARAEADFRMAELGMGSPQGVHDAIVFHAHQGVEKLLKAVMVRQHAPPPRTHDLSALVAYLPGPLRDDRLLRDACAGLQLLWLRSRYPNQPVPTAEQVRFAMEWTRQIRDIVNRAVGG